MIRDSPQSGKAHGQREERLIPDDQPLFCGLPGKSLENQILQFRSGLNSPRKFWTFFVSREVAAASLIDECWEAIFVTEQWQNNNDANNSDLYYYYDYVN